MSGTELPTRRSSLRALAVLTLINLLNYLDRYVVSAIAPDLKSAPLGLSDQQLGWLIAVRP